MTVLTFLKGFSNVKELVSLEQKIGAKVKWPAPPPLLASQLERWGGGYPVETPWIFPRTPNVVWYCLIRSEKLNWGFGFAFYSRKDGFDNFGRKSLQIQPFSTWNYIPPPLNFSICPLTYSIALFCEKKRIWRLWFCYQLEEGRHRRFWPKNALKSSLFQPKITFPVLEFFHSSLLYICVHVILLHFVKKNELGIWFCF